MSKITSPRTGDGEHAKFKAADFNTSGLEEEPRKTPIPISNHPRSGEKERIQTSKQKLKLLRETEMKAAIRIQRKFRNWRKAHPSKFKNVSVQADRVANNFDESLLYTDEFNTFCKGMKEAGPNADIKEITKKILAGMPVTEEQEKRMAIMMEKRYMAATNSK